MITKAIEKITGEKAKMRCVVGEEMIAPSFPAEEKTEKEEIDPYTQKVLNIFNGRVIERTN